MFEQMQHAKFTLPSAKGFHPSHPLRNKKNHDNLLTYLQQRLALGKAARDERLPRLGRIDRDVAGWIIRTDETEVERERKKTQTGQPVAVDQNLPITFIHLDDMMTYFAQTFAPNRGMFYQIAQPEDVDIATQLVTLMNYHAVMSGYYRQLLLAIFAILKYNYGGVSLDWVEEYGPRVITDGAGQTGVEEVKVFAGNQIEALDMYNTMWDPTVHPVDVHKDGEFAAKVKRRSTYWLQQRCLSGLYFNCEDMIQDNAGNWANQNSVAKYYINPPQEARLANESRRRGGDDWLSVLGSAFTMEDGDYELVDITIKINPNDFGLIPGNAEQRAQRNRYEVWRFTILNDERIIGVQHLNNAHSHIPFYFGISNDDTSGEHSKSPAETIQPLGDFASFLMNIHIKACRKNVWGTTYYDPAVVDFSEVPAGEVAARVPIKAQGFGKGIQNYVYHDQATLDTKQTLGDMQGVMDLVNQFFPTQAMPSAIAGIDRAISSQVAAVQQGVNRRQHKGARLMDDTMMRPMRAGMYYNIVQYQQDGEEIPSFYGAPVSVNLGELRGTNLSTVIGQGLMAIDRQYVMGLVQQIVFALIQNPRAAEQVNILALIDYWVAMMDVELKLSQFQLTPEELQARAQAQQPAGEGTGVEPATNPAIVTAPIYGRGQTVG